MQIHKLDKLQAPYLSNLGDTTSPLSRKLTKSASETAFTFLKIPIAPFLPFLQKSRHDNMLNEQDWNRTN